MCFWFISARLVFRLWNSDIVWNSHDIICNLACDSKFLLGGYSSWFVAGRLSCVSTFVFRLIHQIRTVSTSYRKSNQPFFHEAKATLCSIKQRTSYGMYWLFLFSTDRKFGWLLISDEEEAVSKRVSLEILTFAYPHVTKKANILTENSEGRKTLFC